MAAKRPRVMDSAVTENLDGQIDWTINNFLATWPACKKLESPDFKFYFPEVHRTLRFALIVVPSTDNWARIAMINRNPEAVKMTATPLFRCEFVYFAANFDNAANLYPRSFW